MSAERIAGGVVTALHLGARVEATESPLGTAWRIVADGCPPLVLGVADEVAVGVLLGAWGITYRTTGNPDLN